MTVCQHCLEWAPKSRQQLYNRKNDGPEPGDKRVLRCPQCNGTDWVLTAARLEPRKLPLNWLSKLFWRIRHRNLPLWPKRSEP